MEFLWKMSVVIVRVGDYFFVMLLKYVGFLKFGSLLVLLIYGVF